MKKLRPVLLFAFLSVASFAFSQLAPFASPSAPQPAQVITLGSSAVILSGPWKFSPGDSPWVNGSLLWAQSGFDDSRWASMDLTPVAGSRDVQFATSGFVPGWTRRGFPNLVGYAWYRLRIRVEGRQPLWLEMPIDVDDGYQVYVNGQYIGEFGEFHPGGVTLYYGRPVALHLPSPGPGGEAVIALRFYMSAVSPFRWPDAGGPHFPPILGSALTVSLLHKSDKDAVLLGDFGGLLAVLFCLLATPLALWAAVANRQDHAWLWLFLALASELGAVGSAALGKLGPHVSMWAGEFWSLVVFASALQLCWILFWWSWFGLRNQRWIVRIACVLTALYAITSFCFESPTLDLHFAGPALLRACSMVLPSMSLALAALLLVVLFEGFRRDRTAALLATAPILLLGFSSFYVPLLVAFRIANGVHFDNIGITYSDLTAIAMLLIVGALSLRRFLSNRDRELIERESIARDLEQAQQLQQRVLVPEEIRSPGFKIETAYHPAQTVGGDFFQTLAGPDGSLLIVIGDVSGKGVSAAMLVAVMVGAIRNQVESSFDPASMLATLNRRLVGRSGGHFATCLAAQIHPNGQMCIANAGHLPPYLNGKEMDIEGSLPLGAVSQVDYPIHVFTLQPGDHLTFMTDGVVEATNAARELFGFDRTRSISNQPAAVVADQARAFGQEDDITVLSVEFSGVADPAVA